MADDRDALHAEQDGPTEPSEPAPSAAPRRGPGRPKGSRTRKRDRSKKAEREPTPADKELPQAGGASAGTSGGGEDTDSLPLLASPVELASWLAKAGMMAEAAAATTALEPSARALGWHDPETGAPSARCLMASALMWPWLSTSGVLDIGALSPEAKLLIGALILLGPALPHLGLAARDWMFPRPALFPAGGKIPLHKFEEKPAGAAPAPREEKPGG